MHINIISSYEIRRQLGLKRTFIPLDSGRIRKVNGATVELPEVGEVRVVRAVLDKVAQSIGLLEQRSLPVEVGVDVD